MEVYESEPSWTLELTSSPITSCHPLSHPACGLQVRRGGSLRHRLELEVKSAICCQTHFYSNIV